MLVWVLTFKNKNGIFQLDPQCYLHIFENSSCVLTGLYSVLGILVLPQSDYLVCFMALTIISLVLELFVDFASPLLFSAFPKLLDCEL